MGIISKCIAIAATAILVAGCASAPYPAGHEASAGQLVKPHDNREFSLERKATGISHATWVYARSVYENPVNRPVSHAASLGSLALKSTGGLLRRVAIGTVHHSHDVDVAELLHLGFALLLFVEQLVLSRDVSAVELGGNVLAVRLNRRAGDDRSADGSLDGNLELVPRNRFGKLLAAGMTATIFFYVAINLMMVMGLAPVVGIPLPFVSHGGSSMMTNMICIGTLMMVNRWNREAPRLGLK